MGRGRLTRQSPVLEIVPVRVQRCPELIATGDVGGGGFDRQCRKTCFEKRAGARAGDRQGHRRAAQQPAHRDRRQRLAFPFCDSVERISAAAQFARSSGKNGRRCHRPRHRSPHRCCRVRAGGRDSDPRRCRQRFVLVRFVQPSCSTETFESPIDFVLASSSPIWSVPI